VGNTPGTIAFTEIPSRAHSHPRLRVSDSSAVLLAQYAETSRNARYDPRDAMLMTRPCPLAFKGAWKTWQARSAAFRLVLKSAVQSSSVTVAAGCLKVYPAAFTRMSTRPNAPDTASRSVVSECRLVASVV